jgi:hypothetical protein
MYRNIKKYENFHNKLNFRTLEDRIAAAKAIEPLIGKLEGEILHTK